MTRKRLNKLKREMVQARRSPQKAIDLRRFAQALGRKKVIRGKEPTWESKELDVFALTIPNHGGKDIPIGTKNSILNALEDDVLAWEEKLGEEDDEEESDGGAGNGRG